MFPFLKYKGHMLYTVPWNARKNIEVPKKRRKECFEKKKVSIFSLVHYFFFPLDRYFSSEQRTLKIILINFSIIQVNFRIRQIKKNHTMILASIFFFYFFKNLLLSRFFSNASETCSTRHDGIQRTRRIRPKKKKKGNVEHKNSTNRK